MIKELLETHSLSEYDLLFMLIQYADVTQYSIFSSYTWLDWISAKTELVRDHDETLVNYSMILGLCEVLCATENLDPFLVFEEMLAELGYANIDPANYTNIHRISELITSQLLAEQCALHVNKKLKYLKFIRALNL